MHIFIDEAGPFLPPTSKPSAHSLVLALIVPSGRHDQLCYDFLRIRDAWPSKAVELKGSTLNETQTAEIAKLLIDHDVIIDFQAIDMALHPDDLIHDVKEKQAAAITANLTASHQPTLVRQLEELASTFRALSNQLCVQALLTIRLVVNTVQNGSLYHVQRSPTELGRFAWVIDRKDRDLTEMERAWTILIMPAGESQSTTTPFLRLIDGDYSYFEKYEVSAKTADPPMALHMAWMREAHHIHTGLDELHCLNWKRLLTEERSFADSKDHLGLQLADITATTLRRALNNQLGADGWEPFGHLLIHQKTAPFVLLGKPGTPTRHLDPYASRVWRTLTRHAKNMITD